MDSAYRPQSPDLDLHYTPQSPDLTGIAPPSPDLSALGAPVLNHFPNHRYTSDGGFPGTAFTPSHHPPGSGHGISMNNFAAQQTSYQPTSAPLHQPQTAYYPPHQNQQTQFAQPQQHLPQHLRHHQQQHLPPAHNSDMYYTQQQPPTQYYDNPEYPTDHPNAEYNPSPPNKRSRRVKSEHPASSANGLSALQQQQSHPFPAPAPPPPIITQDPTLGCHLRTSFPVARIKRIMQADEDIGKVAQVTPTVVSRALELFMIKLISASAHQARGGIQSNGPGGGGGGGGGDAKDSKTGPRRVLAQHLKKAVLAEERFDFLQEIVDKVPDAPSARASGAAGGAGGRKASVAAHAHAQASDSDDDNAPSSKPASRRRGRKRKDSGDDL